MCMNNLHSETNLSTFFKVSVAIYVWSEDLWESNLDLLHHLQKQFRECNVYLCVHIHLHMYLTYRADSWSKRLWKRMMLIANDLHRSVEICTANLHASSSFLFGDPLCHSPLHPFLQSALLLPKAALSSALHILCHTFYLNRKHKLKHHPCIHSFKNTRWK